MVALLGDVALLEWVWPHFMKCVTEWALTFQMLKPDALSHFFLHGDPDVELLTRFPVPYLPERLAVLPAMNIMN